MITRSHCSHRLFHTPTYPAPSSLMPGSELRPLQTLHGHSLVAQTVEHLPAMRETRARPGSGRSPGEGNDNPLQYSCPENPMDGEAWWATVHGVAKSQTRLSDFTFFLSFMATQGSKINLRVKQASEDELKGGKKMQEKSGPHTSEGPRDRGQQRWSHWGSASLLFVCWPFAGV